jgi:rhamnosyltransferase subunit B
MRVVVTSFGSSGDFNPLLAIAAALQQRGAAVSFVANPFYGERVRAVGCDFVPAGRHLDIFAALEARADYFLSAAGPVRLWRELIAPSIGEIYPVALDAVRSRGATVVVSHVLSYGGAWAARAAGARSAVVATTPMVWLSRHEPLVFANWRAPRALQSRLTVALRAIGGLMARRPLARLAGALGAPPIADIIRDADLNLGVWPEWFRRPAPDDPPRSHACGFAFDPPHAAPLPAEVEAFLAAGAPPVVVGFGSAASLHAAARYRAVAEACRRIGRRCLLIGRSADVRPDAQTLAVERVPYARVFPAAAAIVHHGGFGTCAEALRAGRPALVTPIAFDQFDSAARLADRGLAHWLRGDPSDVGALAAALAATLGDTALSVAADRTAGTIAIAPDGAAHAAELVAAVGLNAETQSRRVRGDA